MSASIALKAAIGVLMVDSIIELAFISSMVSWLHRVASGSFEIVGENGSRFNLRGEPLHMLVNQGHASNGAAGTAFVLIGVGGIVTLLLRNRFGKFGHGIYYFWLVCNVLALMLTVAALGYVFSVTNSHRDQVIDITLAESLKGTKYPVDDWTPQNWFSAFLRLDIADDSVRSDIASHYTVMRGWQFNLIPLFLAQLVETGLAITDGLNWRKQVRYAGVAQGHAQAQEKISSQI